MSATGQPDIPTRVRLPRWVAVLWVVSMAPLVHGMAPWALSSLAHRAGWIQGHPGPFNLLGLGPLIVGAAWITWCVCLHLTEMGESFRLEATPRYLLIRGPYRYSRNPIYLGVFAMWAGWSLFYGNLAVLCGLAAAVLFITALVVPFEERRLQARFGETYCSYRRAVPRFIARSAASQRRSLCP